MNLQETLNYYGITSIWHFTDESNLKSIEKNGLLSLERITQQRIHVPCFGADALSHNLDRKLGLDKFVHLSLIKEHPMQYIKTKEGLIPNPIWLEIDVSVLFETHSIFANDIANKNGVQSHYIDKLADIVDLEVLWSKTDWRDPIIKQRRASAKKSELMVANRIDYSKIKGIYHG